MYHPMAIVVLGGARVCDIYTVAIYSSTAGSVMSKVQMYLPTSMFCVGNYTVFIVASTTGSGWGNVPMEATLQ